MSGGAQSVLSGFLRRFWKQFVPYIGIVDDNPTVLLHMRILLERAGFADVRTHTDPCASLAAFKLEPPSVLLVDYLMPGLDGIELLGELQHAGATLHTPVAMVSGAKDLESIRLCAYRAGAIEVLAKPVNPQEFTLMVRNLARLSTVPLHGRFQADFSPLVVPRSSSSASPRNGAQRDELPMLRMLEKVAAFRDEHTGKHTTRIAFYAAAIAHSYGLSIAQQDQLMEAAPLHDIGNIGCRDDVLHKGNGEQLDEAARLAMQQHTTTGYELLRESPSPAMQLAAEIALTHHECWDGSGYPLGLSGEHIALSGRIVAVADAFDALTTVRPYEPDWLAERARRVIKGDSGSRFDPAVVEAFDSAFESLLSIKRHFDGDKVFAGFTAAAH